MNIILCVGIPGSGKSTFCKNQVLADSRNCWISSDNIRKELLGNESDQSQGNRVWRKFYEDVETAIFMEYENVFVDAVFIDRRSRKMMMKTIQKAVNTKILIGKVEPTVIALVFQVPLWKATWRDLWREKKVKFKVIKKFYDRYEEPQFDEGFTEILYAKKHSNIYNLLTTV